ncbi:Lipoprotein signal peptidase, putative [Perkinsus marinus ATCC 50983]|uniref:Lipoprotein signal peptidase, putative n=1 Tax=Perkinsus marinus (strain ATCC 50983 / TXsc) TaxID=423536 RepID=C5LYV1_PERM5|nr:Lipoprotein signal peptidase, putative [Perkinsus marinus ATCC 50983]EEQ98125.1 Lipoprotein signal peptidase, putative [Perkinsus marinus ATCC 50983]|eukprot:XP_002765408.1 Lipoprotein signal peptidase, putative [Perkinsus marinus ATCC 50983]
MPTADDSTLRRRAEGPVETSEGQVDGSPAGAAEVNDTSDTAGFGYPCKWWIAGGLFLALEFSLKYLAHVYRPQKLITDIFAPVVTFDITYTENRHSAFSFARRLNRDVYRFLMASSVFLVVAGFVYFFCKKDASWRNKLGMFLFMCGAVGNGLDRILLGAVVDYVSISGGYPEHWSNYYLAWNLSDLVIDAAFAVLVYQAYLTEKATAEDSKKTDEKETTLAE